MEITTREKYLKKLIVGGLFFLIYSRLAHTKQVVFGCIDAPQCGAKLEFFVSLSVFAQWRFESPNHRMGRVGLPLS